MTTGQPRIFVPEAELTTATEKTFAAMIESNDEATGIVMDDYPKYWIG
jgi:hypothetical protein